jgi:ATP-dependent Clp protease ATP-binding subunit ClpC
MINNFTPRIQQVLAVARKEAVRLKHNYVGTEHLLLGLILLGEGVAVTVLKKRGLDLPAIGREVEKWVGHGPEARKVTNPRYTPRVKKVLALAGRQAKALGHSYVGTEHLLLGLLQEGKGVAALVLKKHEVDFDRTRDEIIKELGQEGIPSSSASSKRGCLFSWCWWK